MDARKLACVVALAAGCGGEPEAPPGSAAIPLDALCQELAAADCARLAACQALYAPFDVARCEARQASELCAPMQAAFQAARAEQTLDYFELAARGCRDAVGALGCGVGLDHDLLALPACQAMVAGTGTEGDACHLSLACAPGFACDAAQCPGLCVPLLGNNQACTFGDRCAAELYCDLTAMRCLARTDLGGTCGLELSGSACVDGAFCERSNPNAPVCVRARGRNEGCTRDAECAGGARCVRNRCSGGAEGDACVEALDCAPELACVAGSCRARQALDAACAVGGSPCLPGLTCTTTVSGDRCLAQGLPGSVCAPDGPGCFLGACQDGRCRAGQSDGGACGGAADCLPGRTCEGGRCVVVPRDCRR
jgi:hypothetical protein